MFFDMKKATGCLKGSGISRRGLFSKPKSRRVFFLNPVTQKNAVNTAAKKLDSNQKQMKPKI